MKGVIVITGTPGTGKTTISKAVVHKLKGVELIDANDVIKEHKLFSSYDKYGTRIVNMKKLERTLSMLIKGSKRSLILVEGHILCDIKIKNAKVIVIRAHLNDIRRRLAKRGYGIEKTRENLIAEAIDYCGEMARLNYKDVFELWCNKKAVANVLTIIKGKVKTHNRIDLLNELTIIIKKDKRFLD